MSPQTGEGMIKRDRRPVALITTCDPLAGLEERT